MGMVATRIRDFTQIIPPKFHGSEFDEDPQKFIDEVYKIVEIMGLSTVNKAELTTYQLNGVAQICVQPMEGSDGA